MSKRLDVCPKCGEDFVYPVTWAESGPADWWLLLRCGGCGSWRDLVASNRVVEAFDRTLDVKMARIRAAADRLARESLSAQAETFSTALKHPKLESDRDGHLLILRDSSAGFLMHWYGIPDGSTADIENPQLIRACNPASWVSPRALIRELHRPDTDEDDWRRLHLNAWTASRDAWLPAGCWAGLALHAMISSCAGLPDGTNRA